MHTLKPEKMSSSGNVGLDAKRTIILVNVTVAAVAIHIKENVCSV